MRVLAVSSWFPYPPVNGAKLRAYELLRQLARRHAVTLLSFAEGGEAGSDEQAHLRGICESVTVVRGHPFKHGRLGIRGLLSPMPRSLVQTYSDEMSARVAAATGGHDVAVGLQIGAALYLAGRRAAPTVFEEAEVTWLRALRDREKGIARRARLAMTASKYLRYVCRLAARVDRTTVVSDAEQQALVEAGCEATRVRVVPNGVSREHLCVNASRKVSRIVYPGAVTYSANADAVRWFVAEAWPAVRRARPDLSFVVTGSTAGVDVADLERVAGVGFTGHVADVTSLIAESTACVVPLRLGGGTRLKILEAMALGTPVVSTSKGAEGLDAVPGRDILVADDPNALAREVARVAGEPELAARLAANARALVDRSYTWDRIGLALDSVLHEAVDDFHHRGPTR
jgi:polysaccharide biosynthesis protein PslH